MLGIFCGLITPVCFYILCLLLYSTCTLYYHLIFRLRHFAFSHSLPDNEEGSTDGLSPPHPSLSSQSSHTHCTQSYVLNNRLFPIPHSSCSSGDGVCRKKCPVCEGRREGGEGKKPVRYIRLEQLCHSLSIHVACLSFTFGSNSQSSCIFWYVPTHQDT